MVERKTITVNEDVTAVIAKAAEVWPELSHNYSILVGKIIVDWDRIRAGGGGRTDKLCERMDKVESAVSQLVNQIESMRNGAAFILAARDNGCDSVLEFDDEGMSAHE